MKILLDENLDHRLRTALSEHQVFTVLYMGWHGLKNGNLLAAAEVEAFDVLLTGDQSLHNEQNLSGRALAVVALSTVEWRIVRNHLDEVRSAIALATPGSFQWVNCGTFSRKKSTED